MVGFDVDASAYRRFMGRWSEPLAQELVAAAGVRRGQRALDVGCGPGALTAVLADLLGAGSVAAIDPSVPFVAAVRERCPGVDVREGAAEDLPFPDGGFDQVLAQLVVHFMADPVAGLAEMARVARPGGVVAASVWDHAGGGGPLSVFWQAARDLDPAAPDESGLAGARRGHLEELCRAAGLADVRGGTLTVTVAFGGFDDWWEPFTMGVGPAGGHVAGLGPSGRDALRERCAQLLPEGPFRVTATAWCALART